jgi:hypothetical protein
VNYITSEVLEPRPQTHFLTQQLFAGDLVKVGLDADADCVIRKPLEDTSSRQRRAAGSEMVGSLVTNGCTIMGEG